MKLLYYLIPATVLAVTSISGAATLAAKIHDLATETNTGVAVAGNATQDYIFTEAGVGSITLRAVYETTSNGVARGVFTSLDGGVHVGNNADGVPNHFSSFQNRGEGFNVIISLLSADASVDTSSIAFKFDSLGVRNLANDGDFTWMSSSTALATTTLGGGEQLKTLDTSTYGNIANANYSGSFGRSTADRNFQLSDSVPGGNGVVMTANFSKIPEPSSAALLGLGGLALILRRRK